MKRILGIAMALGLVGALTVMAQEMKPVSVEVIDLGKGVKLEMVLIPAGKFMMGSPESEKGRDKDETQHEVILTKPFCMGKYEVTQEQWETIMGDNPSEKTKGSKLPVTVVSWKDCQEFIRKLNAKTNGGYRLPTEAEWEFACRAGATTLYSVGDSITTADANYSERSAGGIKAVGNYKPNAFGLYDMHCNVWEWCSDSYEDYPAAGAVTDPKGPATEGRRVLRGGGFFGSVSVARSSNRYNLSPTNLGYDIGFRLAKILDIKTDLVSTDPKPDPAVVMPFTSNPLVAPFSEAEAKITQKAVARSLQKELEEKVDLGKGIKLDLVLIPAGKFRMGSPTSEEFRKNNEAQHEVTLTKPYYIGKYEVTQEQYEAVMEKNPSSTKGSKLPVTDVSWKDCQEFIKKLNLKTKGGYRLPTEAEWEYACRAGTKTAYSFGENITKRDANYGDGGAESIKSGGSYKPNAFGLNDMHGNAWEWCEDWKADYPAGAATDPKGPETGVYRVVRGGSFYNSVSTARSSFRNDVITSASRDGVFGFRLAKTP